LAAAEERAASGGSAVKPVRFVAINDLHHEDAGCDPWMEALFRQVAKTEGAAFCLGLGDLANRGTLASLQAVRRLSALVGMPFHPCPGNHDLDESEDGAFYEKVFPGRRNHLVRANGWLLVILDTTEGKKTSRTTISKTTLDWLDAALPTLDPLAPLVLCTHFPLAVEHRMCPLNAESVLARLIGHNLRGVFGGHFHGRTSHARGAVELRTCACVARVRDNHDGAPEKGYFVVDGDAQGALDVKFVRFEGV
jgi:3',5'-cyclic AMP phosphodiesterase CpdA